MKKLFKLLALSSLALSVSAFANPNNSTITGDSTHLDANGYSTTIQLSGYEDLPCYLIRVDGAKLTPNKLIVPIGQKFRILVINDGKVGAEFESNQLRFEKVLFPGTRSLQLILPQYKGTYTYFNDFNPNSELGKIIVK